MFFNKELKGNKAKIFVGDPKQAIFLEKNIFDTTALTFKLTHTFRYGGEVVDWINQYGPTHTSNKKTKLLFTGIKNYIATRDIAILIPTWNKILDYLPYLQSNQLTLTETQKKKIKNYTTNHLKYCKREDERHIHNATNTPLSKEDFFDLNNELYLLEYDNNKWGEIDKLLNNKRKKSNSIISTIHGSKGLEYKHVFIDKSCCPEYNNGGWSWKTKDRMFYVAVTRATDTLCCDTNYDPFLMKYYKEHNKKYFNEKLFLFPKMLQYIQGTTKQQ